MDRMLQKQDDLLVEVKDIGQSRNELLVEVKDMNRKIDKVRDNEIIEMKNDIAEVKGRIEGQRNHLKTRFLASHAHEDPMQALSTDSQSDPGTQSCQQTHDASGYAWIS